MYAEVAPLAGAWIEILANGRMMQLSLSSLPSRERGLKFHPQREVVLFYFVAPLAGAWIEMKER